MRKDAKRPWPQRHCAPAYFVREGHAACANHAQCARHWRNCASCGNAASRTPMLSLADPLRQAEAQQLVRLQERERALLASQIPLPLTKGSR